MLWCVSIIIEIASSISTHLIRTCSGVFLNNSLSNKTHRWAFTFCLWGTLFSGHWSNQWSVATNMLDEPSCLKCSWQSLHHSPPTLSPFQGFSSDYFQQSVVLCKARSELCQIVDFNIFRSSNVDESQITKFSSQFLIHSQIMVKDWCVTLVGARHLVDY